ncbi:DUF4012 domain-containing protein [Microbacterium horticulturae]|uniref:DUF4012 domain-containing protein n=1 Tax=Microbacterium horticulturae TaxID=3028316 RepID=A0ABY8C1H6_9MICO|nr:DUF4012 domain-containing protein [Microbacterium sp. KACC 23027]WEG09202.1 DUF4012 domain-containing protein [Microbacterium sp. KACC 23027]
MPVVRTVRARWLVLGLIAAVVVMLAALAWVGVRAIMAKGEIDEVTAHIDEMRQAVSDGDLDKLAVVAEDVAPHVERADALTSDPIWRATEVVPVLGPNLAAARVSSSQLNVLVNDLALPLMKDLPHLGDGKGGIAVPTLQSVATTLQGVDAALQAGQREFAALDLDATLPAVGDGARQLQKITGQVAPIVHGIAPVAHIAPGLLGADATRHILMIVQNNAELRTAGGISGSFVELTADDGHITLKKVASDAVFPEPKKPVADVPASTSKLYGDVIATHVQNTTMPADFAVTADLATAWWKLHTGETPDVVLSIDPVVLASLLQATGPVTVSGTTLNADNAVQELLVNAYLNLDEDQQDPFFEAAATAVFTRLTDGSADPVALAKALQQPLTDGRISAFSARADEQKVLSVSALGGSTSRHVAAGRDAYAVYFNDATGSKMDSFLRTSMTIGSAECRPDDHRDVLITVRLESAAPADAGTSLPGPMTGWGLSGTPAGDISTIVSVAAPRGTFFAGVQLQGKDTRSVNVEDFGFPTSATTVVLKPGEHKTVTFRFTAAHTGAVSPVLLHTPMMTAPTVSTGKVVCG